MVSSDSSLPDLPVVQQICVAEALLGPAVLAEVAELGTVRVKFFFVFTVGHRGLHPGTRRPDGRSLKNAAKCFKKTESDVLLELGAA